MKNQTINAIMCGLNLNNWFCVNCHTRNDLLIKTTLIRSNELIIYFKSWVYFSEQEGPLISLQNQECERNGTALEHVCFFFVYFVIEQLIFLFSFFFCSYCEICLYFYIPPPLHTHPWQRRRRHCGVSHVASSPNWSRPNSAEGDSIDVVNWR